ncbi:MAG: transglutaminase-like domain-containing protein, partial [Actinomycetota bacterium]|nr:transglutaminase-like domain-containing protein [Actinomycetota bacterium]
MSEDPTSRFARLVGRPDAEIPLDEGALLIASHAYPGLDVAGQLARLDDIAAACPDATLDSMRQHLFGVLGFRGNTTRYADPRNSFLNDVLDRRTGIPISLAVVTMEVGRRLGLSLQGVGMPGHFLVRHQEEPPVLFDPFGGGRVVTVTECEELFRSVHGPGAPFDPSLLAPVGARAILTRMLANLRHLYQSVGDARSLGWVLELRMSVPGSSPYELADVASAQAALG